jgi:rhamnose transport system substrate-binding protein
VRNMSRGRRIGLGAVAAVSVLSLAASACGSSKSTSSATTAAPTATTAAPTATTAVAGAGSATTVAPAAGGGGAIKKGLVVYFIPKDTTNPYEVIADNGGKAALAALGGKVVVSSGTEDTGAAQIPSIQAAIQARASAIVVAGNDPTALCPSLSQAQAAGIKIVSFDSDITCPNHLFVNQANTEQIGTSEVDLLAQEIGGKGQIAILSAAATATNQNAWIGYMKQELKKYPGMQLVSTVYGNDDPATSLTVLQGLLSAHPDLRGIISPTTVGISTAAQYLDTHKSLLSHLTLTGLGLPSQMRSYVLDGTVKAFELWNPSNLGYLAGYAAAALASGTATITPGSSFSAGKLGKYTVLAPAAGTGPSIVLGPPTVFNKANINQFNF